MRKKVPLYFVLLAALIPTLLILNLWWPKQELKDDAATAAISTEDSGDISMEEYRLNSFEYTKPLLLTDLPSEDKSMISLKSSIIRIFDDNKATGDIDVGSAFVMRLNNDRWMGVNPGEKFAPGSMLKVSILITYFKMLEKNPGLFNQKLNLTPGMIPNKTQYIDEKHLPPGQYKISELIQAMIVNSDNYATMLLNQNMDPALFSNLYTDLGLPRPDMKATFYLMTAKEFARFWRVLHSATYLNSADSEMALNLLTRSEYKDGFVAGLPAGTKMAHKFGESGDGKSFELHESGIVYYNNTPYLLVVMTRGRDITKLSHVLKDISKNVYQFFSSNS